MSLNALHTSYIKGSYQNDLLFFLKVSENNLLRLNPTNGSYLQIDTDSKSRAVIGYGYDLVANRGQQAIDDLTSAGVILTQAQINAINALTDTTTGIPAALAGLALPSEEAATALLNSAVARRRAGFQNYINSIGGMQESRERAVLESMWYQGQNNYLAPGFQITRALQEGDRAEVWYQIRYQSASDGGGVITRRYAESAYFGLYDGLALNDHEAKDVFRMYTRHGADMLSYDALNAAKLLEAESRYGLNVESLNQSLQPAREYLIAEYVTNKGINISINGEILVGEDGSVMGVGGNDTLQGKNLTNQPPFTPVPSNDLLFGEGGNDNLDGLGGDDVLYGGDGDDILTGGTGIDVLFGGIGNDTLYGNDGAAGDILDGGSGFDTYYADDGDVIRDSDGKGVVYLHGKQLILATRHKGERAYKDALGNIYILNGLTLEVNDPLIIENFTSGDFGLELKEENDPDDPDQSDLAKAFADSKRSIDPIIIDLDGNGFPTRGIGEGAFFDYDGNGFAERTSWISPGDGLLVRDLNANDKIDDGTELFGNYTLLKSGQTAAHGYAALVDLDDNLDGQLDSRDSAWSSLKVWQDTNSDGLTDSGELKTIAEVGIQSIGVTYSETATTDSHGNLHLQQGSFQKTDGSIGQTEDIWLRVNKSSTRQVDPLELNEAIRAMPEIKGMGNVASLRQVMASDPSGPLQYLVQQFAAETNSNIRSDLITKIIYAWTGVENMDPGSRGVYIGDARKIYALEALVGEIWINVRSGTTPLSGEAAVISSVFAQFSRGIAAQLMEQTWYKEIYRAIYYSWNSATQTVTGDLTGILPFFVPNLLANREQGLADLSEFLANLTYTNNMVEFDAPTFLDALAGFGEEVVSTASLALRGMVATSGNDRLLGQDLNETIHGKGGHDFIWAGGGDDQLFGDDGGDFLYGQEGNDTLDGGAGNDLLDGGEGNDIYLFRRGSGQDTIMAVDAAPGKRDVVRFGDGITPGDIELSRSFDNLILKIRDTGDRLVVNGYFINDGVSPTSLEAIEFFGGAVWDFAAVKAQLPPVSTEGSDQIYGFNTGDTINGLGGDDVIDGRGGDDVLIGGAGNDSLDGGAGNDTLDGGVGNDYLHGGAAGSDTFLFNLGYGQDTILDSGDSAASVDIIQFGAGILEDDISFSRSGTALILNVNGTSDQIRILNWFAGVGFQIEQVKFADATIWDAAYLQARASAIPIVGTSGNDYLVGDFGNNTLDGGLGHDYLAGYEGNDTLDGGVGNDSLAGGVGNDIYVFGRGYGQDTVYEYDVAEGNSDTILLKSDVAPGDVSLWRDRFNLVLGIVGTSDVMTLQNWFAHMASRVERIEFSDGTVWDVSILEALPLLGTSASDYLVGGPGKDVIEAGAGDDTVYAGGGNDIVNGGTGNDYLYGDVGNDIVNGGMDNDYLDGGEGNDTLDGEAGDDYLDGGTGNDTLIGGIGNDYLSGGDGSDTYLFARGDGQDSIEEYDLGSGGQDIIRFAADIQPGEIELSRDSSSLFIKVLGTEDQITVSGFFDSPAQRIARVEFADDTVWDEATLASAKYLGTDGADYLIGSDDSEVIEAGAGDDTVYAGGGNDIVNGGTGNDYLYGDVGNDIVNGGMDNDYLDGGEGNDTLDGEAGDDYLDGGTGNDTLIGGIGNDYLSGGDGSDTYLFARGDGQDSIEEYDLGSGGQDIIRFAADIQPGEIELSRDSSSLFIKVLGTEDQITVSGFFDSPAQRIERVELADGTVWATSALLAAKFVGTEGADSIYGTSSNDVIEGRGGDDYLYGDAGADTLDGGTGNDTLDGGAGNDTYVFAQGYGQDTIYETSGTDTLRFAAGITVPDVFVWRDDYNYYFDLIGTNDRVTVDNWYSGSAYRIENVAFADGTVWNSTILNSKTTTASEYADFYWGTGSANTYNGLAGDDRIYGFGGNDNLSGGEGNDFIDGGIGNDVMSGGLGDDTYVVDSATDSVIELANEGNDTVQTSTAYTLGANVENLVLLEVGGAINGTGNELDNILTGNSSANVLTAGTGNDQLDGGAGNDTLDGGTGADIMIGGVGSDTYVVDDIGDVVVELAGQGTDTVQSSISYVLGENVEKLTLTGTAAIDGTGNALDNTLTGNTAANTLIGGAGNDSLNGGAGADTMIGGTGDDTYTVDNIGDVVVESVDEGIDTVRSSINYTLSNDLENLTLTGSANRIGTGNAVDNVLIGNTGSNTLYGLAGNDFLDGGAGADTLVGGTGDDTYIVDNAADIVTEIVGEGTDTVQASITYTLAANVENLVLLESGGAINGTGNGLDNIITGNSANNTLNGGVGADTLVGGLGDDIYVVDALDTVIENFGEGTDTVQAGFTYTLGANIEKLTLTGAAAINGYGNELNNTLTGNSAANVLAGGLGNDIYVIGSTDTVVENLDEGVDTVQASFSYTLTANVENLTLTGSSAINGTGNELDNTLTGNSGVNVLYGFSGNDWLDGKAGADTMVGGSGDDTYVVDNTGDVVTELAGEGIDTVRSTITYTLGSNVENLILTGSTAINGTGNVLDNVLTGNTGANSLFGGAGNDTLNGGTGADTMVGGVGDDIYYVDNTGDIVTENAGEGNDSVISTIAYTLGANLENLTLSGSSGIAGTGNSASNIIIGNGGANTLWGRDGDDMLLGGAGADSLNGENGNDFLDGGTGNDTLTGGTGNDTYILDRGYGTDTVIENDATAGNTDVAQFLSGVAADQIWFKKATNNLEVSIIGTSDKLVIKDWYLGNAYHVEQFKTTDGAKTLTDSNVQNLVNAMASFAPPAAGQTTLPTNYQTSLAPVIAANWQ